MNLAGILFSVISISICYRVFIRNHSLFVLYFGIELIQKYYNFFSLYGEIFINLVD